MPLTSGDFFRDIFSHLLLLLNPPAPPAGTQPISDPNSTTTTSLPSPANNPISPTQSDRPILSFNPSLYLESNQPSPIPIPNNIDIELPDWKRTGKVVQTVGSGAFGVFITLLVNNPTSATTHPALYIAYLTFLCLGLTTNIYLLVFSIIKKGSPTVAMVQKKLIYFTLFFVVLASFFRLKIALPLIHLGFVIFLVLIGMLVVVLYLRLSSRCQRQINGTDTDHEEEDGDDVDQWVDNDELGVEADGNEDVADNDFGIDDQVQRSL